MKSELVGLVSWHWLLVRTHVGTLCEVASGVID